MNKSLPRIDMTNSDHITYNYPDGNVYFVSGEGYSSSKVRMVLTMKDLDEIIAVTYNPEIAVLAYAKLVVKFRSSIHYKDEAEMFARILASFWGKHAIMLRVVRLYSDGSFILDITTDDE